MGNTLLYWVQKTIGANTTMNLHTCVNCTNDLVEGDARMITVDGPICMVCVGKEKEIQT